MQSFTLVIYAAPDSQSSSTALNFAREILHSGHEIYRLFFYQDGVLNACSFNTPSQDEENLPASWQAFIQEHSIDAVVCVASALKRGIINESEAERYELPASNLREGFEISGLGQLIDGLINSDRLVNFLP
ncbi:sulfurtransferase complex subunit TusD [Haliea sp. AH-315-K21]|uniref:Sulfurtransferase complex subunit TusD n=1 Tax=SAR86 cluster bacterium TaxID=2030880 RepID=A0A2A5CF03_9GAMM|nr:sulfurtransferase complex subunit TusD [Haliea sp. AH-315-K21]PCJ42075.1 MAG: sulfurtransferase complex subunit TusD [SAR86 cluster bacterium]